MGRIVDKNPNPLVAKSDRITSRGIRPKRLERRQETEREKGHCLFGWLGGGGGTCDIDVALCW